MLLRCRADSARGWAQTCMQQVRRQLLTALASHSPSSSTGRNTSWLSSLLALQCPRHCRSVSLASSVHTSSGCPSVSCLPKHPLPDQQPLRTFATKAEEYDLIVAEAGLVRIEGYDDTGFIVNDIQVQGAVFCVGDLTTVWNVSSWQELTPDSLSMLQMFKPAPDLVILGCGLHSQMVPPTLQSYFKQNNIAFEAIDTANAVSTFNILNQEGRKVAGCLLPAGSI